MAVPGVALAEEGRSTVEGFLAPRSRAVEQRPRHRVFWLLFSAPVEAVGSSDTGSEEQGIRHSAKEAVCSESNNVISTAARAGDNKSTQVMRNGSGLNAGRDCRRRVILRPGSPWGLRSRVFASETFLDENCCLARSDGSDGGGRRGKPSPALSSVRIEVGIPSHIRSKKLTDLRSKRGSSRSNFAGGNCCHSRATFGDFGGADWCGGGRGEGAVRAVVPASGGSPCGRLSISRWGCGGLVLRVPRAAPAAPFRRRLCSAPARPQPPTGPSRAAPGARN